MERELSMRERIEKLGRKRKYHHMQETRRVHIQDMMGWEESKNKDRRGLLRRAMLTFGCTREKARDYVFTVLGDEE